MRRLRASIPLALAFAGCARQPPARLADMCDYLRQPARYSGQSVELIGSIRHRLGNSDLFTGLCDGREIEVPVSWRRDALIAEPIALDPNSPEGRTPVVFHGSRDDRPVPASDLVQGVGELRGRLRVQIVGGRRQWYVDATEFGRVAMGPM